MPRLARKHLKSSFIHIIVQGINKEYIFQKNSFKEAYLNILKKNIESISLIEKADFEFVSFDSKKITYQKKLINK